MIRFQWTLVRVGVINCNVGPLESMLDIQGGIVPLHGAQGYAVTAAMTASQRRQENVINLFLLSAEQLLIKAKSKPVCSRKGSWMEMELQPEQIYV